MLKNCLLVLLFSLTPIFALATPQLKAQILINNHSKSTVNFHCTTGSGVTTPQGQQVISHQTAKFDSWSFILIGPQQTEKAIDWVTCTSDQGGHIHYLSDQNHPEGYAIEIQAPFSYDSAYPGAFDFGLGKR